VEAEADNCPRLLPSADGLFFHRRKNLAGVLQGLDESRRVHLIHRGSDLHLSDALDELRNAEAFEPSWRLPKATLGHRAEQALPPTIQDQRLTGPAHRHGRAFEAMKGPEACC